MDNLCQNGDSHGSKVIHSDQQALDSGMEIDTEPRVSANWRLLQNIRGGETGNMTLRYSCMEKERVRAIKQGRKKVAG